MSLILYRKRRASGRFCQCYYLLDVFCPQRTLVRRYCLHWQPLTTHWSRTGAPRSKEGYDGFPGLNAMWGLRPLHLKYDNFIIWTLQNSTVCSSKFWTPCITFYGSYHTRPNQQQLRPVHWTFEVCHKRNLPWLHSNDWPIVPWKRPSSVGHDWWRTPAIGHTNMSTIFGEASLTSWWKGESFVCILTTHVKEKNSEL